MNDNEFLKAMHIADATIAEPAPPPGSEGIRDITVAVGLMRDEHGNLFVAVPADEFDAIAESNLRMAAEIERLREQLRLKIHGHHGPQAGWFVVFAVTLWWIVKHG